MTRIRVSARIRAPRGDVWEAVRDIASHTRWMRDARSIAFTSSRREGVGTTFDCATRLGPFRTVDRMEVTEWDEGRAMGILHRGAVSGAGRFSLRPGGMGRRRSRTRFTWDERLRFPWWMGGPVGSAAARPLLRRLWKGNLRRLKALVEGAAATRPKPAKPRHRR